ncbi:MAG TPA: hypothetical protein VEI49_13060 [Terriglobales bacterium]|nr:hypothetical protein [Terriglobales bacterium]
MVGCQRLVGTNTEVTVKLAGSGQGTAQPDMTEFFDFVNPPWVHGPKLPAQNSDGACYLDHLP